MPNDVELLAYHGNTTTPFDMVMLNDLDRYHLVTDVIDRIPDLDRRTAALRGTIVDARLTTSAWPRHHGEDHREMTGWAGPEVR